jgi:hypothetical protein
MAISPRLRAYLAFEQEMRSLDAIDDDLAEVIRDAMDPIWYALSGEDRAFLRTRGDLRVNAVQAQKLTPEMALESAHRQKIEQFTIPTEAGMRNVALGSKIYGSQAAQRWEQTTANTSILNTARPPTNQLRP